MPKRTKFAKVQKGKIQRIDTTSIDMHFGSYALKALEPGKITAKQIEAFRKIITRKIKKIGKLWIRIFPNIPISKKPAEVRMGKGKGATDHWACRIATGKVLFELEGLPNKRAESVLLAGSKKLPIKTKVIAKPIN